MNDAVLQLEITRGQRRSGSAPAWLAWTLHPRDYYIAWLIILAVAPYVLYYLDCLSNLFGLGKPVYAITGITSDFGVFFLDVLLVQHFVLLLLITPISLASSFSIEKSRGILGALLASNLTPADIVLGKFAARAGHIGWMLLTGLPVLCFLGVPGGLNLPMIAIVIVVSAVMIFMLGAASMLAAVRCRKATDAFITVLLAGGCAVAVVAAVHLWSEEWKVMGQPSGLATALDSVLQLWNPLPIWDAVRVLDPKESWFAPLAMWALAWACAGGAFLILAATSLRPAYLREAEEPAKARRRCITRPPVSGDPVYWKARHVDTIAVLPGLRRLPRWTGPALVFAGNAGFFLLWQHSLASALHAQSIVFGLLLISVVAFHVTQTVFTENDTGVLMDLRLTGIEPRELVRSKIRGMFQASLPYLAAGALPGLIAAGVEGIGAFLLLSVCLLVLAFCLYSSILLSFELAFRFQQSWQAALMAVYVSYCFAGGIVYIPALLLLFGGFAQMPGRSSFDPGTIVGWAEAVLGTICLAAFGGVLVHSLLRKFFPTFVTTFVGNPFRLFANRRIVRHLERVVQTEDPRRSIRLGLINPSAWAQTLFPAPDVDLEPHWKELASKDERKADMAIFILRRAMKRAVAHMKTCLHPVPPVDSARIAELIQALDSDDALAHEKAARELASLDGIAEPHLIKLLARSTSSRLRARVAWLLEELESQPFPEETRRGLRAIEVLERIGTDDAREILRSLAEGAEEAAITQASRAALQRLIA